MAIRKATTYRGIQLANGYHVVGLIAIHPVRKTVQLRVDIYADQAASANDENRLGSMEFLLQDKPAVVVDGVTITPAVTAWTDFVAASSTALKNPLKAAQAYLLTRLEFRGATEDNGS